MALSGRGHCQQMGGGHAAVARVQPVLQRSGVEAGRSVMLSMISFSLLLLLISGSWLLTCSGIPLISGRRLLRCPRIPLIPWRRLPQPLIPFPGRWEHVALVSWRWDRGGTQARRHQGSPVRRGAVDRGNSSSCARRLRIHHSTERKRVEGQQTRTNRQ